MGEGSDSDGPLGSGDYLVQDGDGFSSIAEAHGFFADTLWNLPENAALKEGRRSKEVLMAGDRVHIPDLRLKEESRATDLVHRFKRRGVPVQIRFQVRAQDGTEFGEKDYVLRVGKRRYEGKTGSDGRLEHWVAPAAKSGRLTVQIDEPGYPATLAWTLGIGRISPAGTLAGLQERLTNLGYDCGDESGEIGPETRAALNAFRTRYEIEAPEDEDTIDAATREKILSVYGV